jgi:predicted nucleic-acid-binding protein
MNAIDTNILARYFLNDDAVQSPLAREIIKQGAYVSNSVILEIVWLLQSRYEQSSTAVTSALLAVINMPDIIVSDALALQWALQKYAAGGDFADMLHLVEAAGYDHFCTFDRKLAKQAGADSSIKIRIIGK